MEQKIQEPTKVKVSVDCTIRKDESNHLLETVFSLELFREHVELRFSSF